MDEVVVVHVLSVEKVAVLPLAQVLWVDAVCPEELLIGDAERLTDGLSDQLGLREIVMMDNLSTDLSLYKAWRTKHHVNQNFSTNSYRIFPL